MVDGGYNLWISSKKFVELLNAVKKDDLEYNPLTTNLQDFTNTNEREVMESPTQNIEHWRRVSIEQ